MTNSRTRHDQASVEIDQKNQGKAAEGIKKSMNGGKDRDKEITKSRKTVMNRKPGTFPSGQLQVLTASYATEL